MKEILSQDYKINKIALEENNCNLVNPVILAKKNTLHIVHVLEATAGGTLRHVRELSAALETRGLKQTLILSPLRKSGGSILLPSSSRREQDAPATFFLPMTREISPLRDAVALVKLVRLLRKLRPDVVHAHSSKAGGLARMACAWLRVPCVYTPHGLAFLDTTLGGFRRAVYVAIEKGLARWTSGFVAVSREEAGIAREVLRLPTGRIYHIPNGSDFRLSTSDERQTTNDERRTTNDAIAFIGREAPQKGLDIFLKAAALLKEKYPALRVISVTDAPDEVAAWQEAGLATVLVMPSRWEGLPYTLLDAMARGKAVVATRVGGMVDVLRDGENGLLVEPENAGAVAEACGRLLEDGALRERLGKQAREDARGCGVGEMAARYAALYEGFFSRL